MALSFKLTDEQQKIIEFDEGALLVQAGAGAGKTVVLTQRIIRLLKNSAGHNFRILALTFTNKAAENIRGLVEQEEDRMALLAKGLIQEGLTQIREKNQSPDDKMLRSLLLEIGRHKPGLKLQDAIVEKDEDSRRLKIAYGAYNRQLELHHGLDFDDLLVLTYRLFVESPRVAKHYRRIYNTTFACI